MVICHGEANYYRSQREQRRDYELRTDFTAESSCGQCWKHQAAKREEQSANMDGESDAEAEPDGDGGLPPTAIDANNDCQRWIDGEHREWAAE